MSNVENPRSIEYPKVVSRAEWLNARKELLAKEKDLTRRRDALNADRRRLPMVGIENRVRRKKETIMTVKNGKPSNQAEIRRLMDNWAEAIRSKDVNGVMSQYAPDVEAFDLAPPLQYRGADAYRKNWEGWFPTFRGSIGYEIRDLTISASDDIAFCHSFNRITGTRTDNENTDVWVRATVCFRKIRGKWKIVHEHQSVPFYMDGSFRAAVDLTP